MKQATLIGLICLAVFTVYAPNISNEFSNWDLPAYNTVLQADKPVNMAWRLITDFKGRIVTGYYAPLCSISLMLDKYLVGSKHAVPKVTKTVNLLIHLLNGILVYLLISLITGSPVVSALAMTIFLVHPVQVQSVLWFTQRKTLLGAMCCLASLTFL